MSPQFEWLYTRGGDCEICKDLRTSHHEDCPVRLIESLRVEVSWEAESIPSWSEEAGKGSFEATTEEEAVQQVAAYAHGHGMGGIKGTARYVSSLKEDVTPDITLAFAAIENKRRSEESERRRLSCLAHDRTQRDRQIKELNDQRGDLLPEAYDRRMAEILAKYASLKD